ncbi:DegV family protein [Gorillibacterium timonense]|uniref:DegV family protein n=1 Tax=Gorillibacterium timonense TaxID=1689269 RepID=UPI00071D11A4|nr:DegV family protein [Gorillibacterium timonense]
MTIKIFTDSAADLPKELVQRHGIEVVPLMVIDGDKEYEDNVTLDPADMFRGMRQGTAYKTSQISYQTLYSRLSSYAEQGQSCLYLAFSSALSGTYQTGVMVKNDLLEQYPDFELEVLDTKCASFGEGMVVLKTAELAAQGKGMAELVEAAAFYARHMEHIFTVDDLKYLLRGGRVSPIAAFIGGILQIKPILDVEDGKLIPIEKVRGRKKALQRMVEIIRERGVALDKQTIGISHGDDLEAAEQVASMIREAFGTPEVLISTVGASVGAHSGPGTLAIFFLNKERD